MEKRKTLVRALGGVLIGGLLLSGGMAFAGDTNSSASDSPFCKIPFFGRAGKHLGGMMKGGDFKQNQQQISDSLKALVEKGTITQEQSDKVLQKFENPIAQLVSDKVITQEQAAAFHQAMRDTVQKQNQQRISDELKALVEKGTLTQAQSDKILKKLEDVRKDREALVEKLKGMTNEERRQYKQDNKEKQLSPLSQLVSEGTITQEQADAVGKVLFHQKWFKGGPRGFKGGRF